jgi:hypothetical protein
MISVVRCYLALQETVVQLQETQPRNVLLGEHRTPTARAVPRWTARVRLPKPGGSTSTLLTLLLAFVRSFADDQPADQ